MHSKHRGTGSASAAREIPRDSEREREREQTKRNEKPKKKLLSQKKRGKKSKIRKENMQCSRTENWKQKVEIKIIGKYRQRLEQQEKQQSQSNTGQSLGFKIMQHQGMLLNFLIKPITPHS